MARRSGFIRVSSVTLAHLLVFSAFAPLARLLARAGARQWLMLAASVAAIYWLQPLTPIRYLDFWFPTAALGLAICTWAATRPGAGASRPMAAARPAAAVRPAAESRPAAAAQSAARDPRAVRPAPAPTDTVAASAAAPAAP